MDDPEFKELVRIANEINDLVSSGFALDFLDILRYLPRTAAQKRYLCLCKRFQKIGADEYKRHVDTFTKGMFKHKLSNECM